MRKFRWGAVFHDPYGRGIACEITDGPKQREHGMMVVDGTDIVYTITVEMALVASVALAELGKTATFFGPWVVS